MIGRIVALALAAVVGGAVGAALGGSTYPSHPAVQEAVAQLIPAAASESSVSEISGWEPLVGPYRAYADFEGGAADRASLLAELRGRAASAGWHVGEATEHPGAIEVPIAKTALEGSITVFGPPEVATLGGRVRLQYEDGVDGRPVLGAAAGSIFGVLAGVAVLRRRSSADRGS